MAHLMSYAPLGPEILLVAGAMLLLVYGVFRPETDREGLITGWLGILVLVLAGVLIARQPGGVERVFDTGFVIDPFARFMKMLALIGAAASLFVSFEYMRAIKTLKFEFPALILLATAGMMVMISANDLIALYLGLEMQSLALYVIAAFRRDDVRSSEAGLKYFVLGTLSSGMLLYGASLIYGFTGSTSFAHIADVASAAGAAENVGLTFGLVFLIVGFAFKISAVPFHMWTPDVYEGAPTPVATFFAAAPKVAAMALFIRVAMDPFKGIAPQWQQIVVFLAVASMILGAFAAIGQTNIKRLLAYSSIGHMGYALIGLAAATTEGVAGVLIYIAIYVAMTLGAFAVVLAMRRQSGPVEEIDELAGLAKTNLPMATILAVLLFALAGVPPLAGFFAKFYVFLAAIQGGFYTLAVIGVVTSVIGAYYYLRIVKVMFFDEAKAPFLPVEAGPGIVMAVAALLMVVYVFWPAPLVDAAQAAAKTFGG